MSNKAEGLRVLSLFDGISCGRVALERAGILIKEYYASEIDKAAITISKKNYPDIIQIGDVEDITREQVEEMGNIDLLIGGSPCQGLSSANVWLKDGEYGVNGTGKSRLFWQFIRILHIVQGINPKVKFLYENVGSASKADKEIINKELNCIGVPFNSQLLSAQNRNRVYWTNIDFDLPAQRKEIYMQDILEDKVDDKYYLTEKMCGYVLAPATKGWQSGKMDIDLKIARPLTASMHNMHRADTDNYVSTQYKPANKTNVRRLTPLECERLQTLPDNYTDGVSDTQRYKCIGNGWTVDVIAWIFRGLE